MPVRSGGLRLAVAATIAWAGVLIHNLAEFRGETALSPDSAGPAAVTVVLVVCALIRRSRRAGSWLLLGWAWLNLVGGAVISVLPLSILPYRPEQSFQHYGIHVVYGVLQVPLVVTATRYLRRTTGRTSPATRPGPGTLPERGGP